MSGPGRGGNLTQPLKKVLINEPSAENLGVFTDSNTSTKILQFLKHGYSLPYNSDVSIKVMKPQDPVHKIAVMKLSDDAPSDADNYAYGVKLIRRERRPGVQNSYMFPHMKYYGGVMKSVTSPTISTAELNEMRDDIIKQINADTGYTRRPDYQRPGAAAYASIPIYLKTWNADSAMTLDGNVVAAKATIDEFVAEANSVEGYAAFKTGDTTLTVVKTTASEDAIVFESTAGSIETDDDPDGEIVLVQRWDEATFEVEFDENIASVETLVETVFPLLTPEDIFQIFSYIPNRGFLAQESYADNMPLKDTKYVRVNIDVPMDHYDLHGASHTNGFINAVELYVPETEWDTDADDKWATAANDKMMTAGTDANLEDLINYWKA